MDFDYIKVAARIAEDIKSGTFLPGSAITSERDLCELFSVSRTTIRRAIEDLVSRNILIRKPGKGTFVNTFKSDEKALTGNVLFLRCIHSDLDINSTLSDDVFYPKILAGIEIGASRNGIHCLVKTINENDPDFSVIEQLADKVDGILCGELHNESFLVHLKSLNLPIVLISPSVHTGSVDIVEIADSAGASDAVQSLLERGHTKIGFIGGSPRSLPAQRRKKGFVDTIIETGMIPVEKWIKDTSWCQRDGFNCMKEFLEAADKPTAVVAASDLLALGAFNAVIEAGKKVPDDISIIGFDGIEMVRNMKPAMATMQVRTLAIGETAFRLLAEQLDRKRDYPVRISIPAELIEGESMAVVRETAS